MLIPCERADVHEFHCPRLYGICGTFTKDSELPDSDSLGS